MIFFVVNSLGSLANLWVLVSFFIDWSALMQHPHNLFIFNLALTDGVFNFAFIWTGVSLYTRGVAVGDQFTKCDLAGG